METLKNTYIIKYQRCAYQRKTCRAIFSIADIYPSTEAAVLKDYTCIFKEDM